MVLNTPVSMTNLAAAAAVGGGFLRKDGIPEGVCNWKEIGSNNSAAE